MRSAYQELLEKAYQGFNARDIDAVLSLMAPDVDWPNGWEGGHVHGPEEIRAYWTRQWQALDSFVEPLGFKETQDGRLEVKVHQVGKDGNGKVLFDTIVNHVYTIEKGLIKKMEIETAEFAG